MTKAWIVKDPSNDREQFEITEGFDLFTGEHYVQIERVDDPKSEAHVRRSQLFKGKSSVACDIALMLLEATKESAQRRVAHAERMERRDAAQKAKAPKTTKVIGKSPRQIHEPEFCPPSDAPPWEDEPAPSTPRTTTREVGKPDRRASAPRRTSDKTKARIATNQIVKMVRADGSSQELRVRVLGKPRKGIGNVYNCRACGKATVSDSSGKEVPCAGCGLGGVVFVGTEVAP